MRLSNTIIIILIIILIAGTVSCSTAKDDFSERTKIALRDVGNELLLSNQDSTSLILPIKEIETNTYLLSFDSSLSFEPNSLVAAVRKSFGAIQLPNDYRVEVIQCSDGEVAYSYQITNEEENTLIPCVGRYLPNDCYLIEIKFTKRDSTNANLKYLLAFFLIIVLICLCVWFYKTKHNKMENNATNDYERVGSFKFYQEQNKLVKEAEEIALSKKECELLSLFVERPNEIIKRDELTKKVWEDNGVFVGRSLDTYISKLRKKLQSDNSVNLTNVHGVGYKLEVS